MKLPTKIKSVKSAIKEKTDDTVSLSTIEIEKKLKQLEKLKQEKKFFDSFLTSLKQAQAIKEGRLKTKPIEYLLNEL